MTGYVVENNGFISASSMMADIIGEMLDNGFTQVDTGSPFDPETAGDAYYITMEASIDVDPLSASQPWRMRVEAISKESIKIVVAPPLQLPNDGSYTSGLDSIITYIDRTTRVGSNGNLYPLSYSMSITPRGVYIASWEDAGTTETSNHFNWVLVQRPVDRETGEVVTTGKAPVWCVNFTSNIASQFVVRESDILKPGKKRSASTNEDDSEAILNINTLVRLTEDGKYVLNFPSRLNTSRHRYPHELDMIATTSADVVSQDTMIELTVYGEEDPRKYKALQANMPGNTGVRIMSLQFGGGIS